MKLHIFVIRLQELIAYLEDFPPDTEGHEIKLLSTNEIMDIIFYSMPTTWKKKMNEQGLNSLNSTIKEMTDFFETRVEKKKYYTAS